MHKGSIVSIDSGVVHLKRSLLSPLSIEDDSTIYGLYYPSNHTSIRDKKYVIDPDFMFTNVPPRMWYSVAKFVFFIKHEPGTIAEITEYLKRNSVNILTADSTRAGHRFIYLTIVGEFELLSDEDNLEILYADNSEKNVIRKQIHLRSEIDRIINGIIKAKKKVIFDQKYGREKFGGIECFIVNSLQFFYDVVGRNAHKSEIYIPFEVKVNKSKLFFEQSDWDTKFSNVIGPMVPTYGFATTSTRDLNIRVQVIPRETLKEFRNVRINYVRSDEASGGRGTTKGFTSEVSRIFSNNGYNIWSLENYYFNNKLSYEPGRLDIVVQRIESGSSFNNLKKDLSKFVKTMKIEKGINVEWPNISKMSRFPIFVSMRSKDQMKEYYKEQFIEVGKKFGLTREDFIFFENNNNPDITQSIIDNMKKCEAMIQIHTLSDLEEENTSIWLESEGMLARGLGIPFAIICHERVKDSLKINRDHAYIKIKVDVEARDIETALNRVIKQKKGDINRI